MDLNNISGQAEHYVRDYFDLHQNGKLLYHNLYHTEKVVRAARQIGQHYQLGDTDLLVVITAAWFHDTGYLQGGPQGHEERGARLAATFLQPKGVEPATIERIRQCILATQLPQRAVSLDEQIVCDADLFHLGTDEFAERNKLLRKEAEALSGAKISKEDWRKSAIRLLEGHQYYTDYCRDLLSEKQWQNLEELHEKEEKHEGHGTHSVVQGAGDSGKPAPHPNPAAERPANRQVGMDKLENILHQHLQEVEEEHPGGATAAGKKPKKKDPGRSIDTVFRITSNNNQRLSSQADSKAHILIQVNAIIISVVLSVLLRRIENHSSLAIPAILLVAVNLITIIFSILATRPQIPSGRFTRADLDEKRVNLLFFGNFYRMSLEEYAGGMLQMMEDRDFLYGSLIRDVYFQGIALGRKYRWLRWSYSVFMYGLIISVTAFVIAALAFPDK